MGRKRATTQKARRSKTNSGVINPDHLDRKSTKNAKNIDPERSKDNVYGNYYGNPEMSQRETEEKFYKEKLSPYVEAQNERYIKARHKERVKTVDQYRKSRNTGPEETLYYVGNKDDSATPDKLLEIFQDHLEWRKENFPNLVNLGWGLHVDEQGAPHIHCRDVWLAENERGELHVSQEEALKEMGIERPNLEEKSSRYNNRKMTFTAMEREHFLEVCKKHGFDIITEPDKDTKGGRDLRVWQYQKDSERAERASQEAMAMIEACRKKEQELDQGKKELDRQKRELDCQKRELKRQKEEVDKERGIVNEKEQELAKIRHEMNNEYLQAKRERDEAIADCERAKKRYQEEKRKWQKEKAELSRKIGNTREAINAITDFDKENELVGRRLNKAAKSLNGTLLQAINRKNRDFSGIYLDCARLK